MRTTLALLGAVIVAALLAVLVPGSAAEVVALPVPGSLSADTTSSGTPVWIGHRRDDGSAVAGDIWVVDATAPGSGELVAHCPVTGQLVDAATGDRFDPRGRVIEAGTDAGLTPLRHEQDREVLRIVERLPAYPNLGLGAADTATGRSCTPDELVRHPGR